MQLIDGKMIQDKVKKETAEFVNKINDKPHVIIIQVGNNSESCVYVNQKKKHCEDVGIECQIVNVSHEYDTQQVISVIDYYCTTPCVHGVMVQLPLPDHMDERKILDAIDPLKDIDGLSTASVGGLHTKTAHYLPCTPKGILRMLDEYEIDVCGKRALVIGRSHIVGSPIQELLTQRNATVTMIHSKSDFKIEEYSNYDIIVVAVGKKEFITNEHISLMKRGVVIIDVGINVDTVTGKMYGDVVKELDERSKDIIGYVTPVPGGVGRTTVSSLIENIVAAYTVNDGQR